MNGMTEIEEIECKLFFEPVSKRCKLIKFLIQIRGLIIHQKWETSNLSQKLRTTGKKH